VRVAALVALAACAGGPPCVEVTADCDPLYEPTFDEIHARTLLPTCAVGGCHSGSSPTGGLDYTDPDHAWEVLQPYVDGEDLGCTTLIRYLHAADPADGMPPGAPLDESERCVLRQWVHAGAPR